MSGLALANPRVQRLRRLFGRRSFRVSEGVFVVEGAKVLAEAFDAGAVVEALYVVSGTRDAVIDRAVAGGVRVFELAVGVMEKVSDTVSPQPVLGVVGYSGFVLDDLRAGLSGGGFVVVGVELQDPGNAGTVIRSAEGAGAAGVVLCDGSVEATNPKTVRSTAGALFHLPVVQSTLSRLEVVSTLQSWGVRVWATSSVLDGAAAYESADLRGPTAIVLGNEANGLPSDVIAAVDGIITIPMAGRTESLNVGMAGAILAFEAARQRRT